MTQIKEDVIELEIQRRTHLSMTDYEDLNQQKHPKNPLARTRTPITRRGMNLRGEELKGARTQMYKEISRATDHVPEGY